MSGLGTGAGVVGEESGPGRRYSRNKILEMGKTNGSRGGWYVTLWDVTGRAEPVQWAVQRSAGKRQTLKGFQLHSLGSEWVSLADSLCIGLMIPTHGFDPAAFFF